MKGLGAQVPRVAMHVLTLTVAGGVSLMLYVVLVVRCNLLAEDANVRGARLA
jgi:hypothetical protein